MEQDSVVHDCQMVPADDDRKELLSISLFLTWGVDAGEQFLHIAPFLKKRRRIVKIWHFIVTGHDRPHGVSLQPCEEITLLSFIRRKKKNKDCEDFKPTASKPQTDTLLREIISNIIGIVTTGKLGVFRLFVDKSTASARAAQDEQEQQLRPELICWSAAQCWFTFITAEPQHSLRSAHNVHTDQVSSDLGSAVHSANAYTVHKNKYFQDY